MAHKEVEAILGPYRGQRLTMLDADADAAVNDHWARDPYAPPEDPHDPLTEQERTDALAAAQAWAQAQWDAAQGNAPPEPPVEPPPETRQRRAMHSDEHSGSYKTRGR